MNDFVNPRKRRAAIISEARVEAARAADPAVLAEGAETPSDETGVPSVSRSRARANAARNLAEATDAYGRAFVASATAGVMASVFERLTGLPDAVAASSDAFYEAALAGGDALAWAQPGAPAVLAGVLEAAAAAAEERRAAGLPLDEASGRADGVDALTSTADAEKIQEKILDNTLEDIRQIADHDRQRREAVKEMEEALAPPDEKPEEGDALGAAGSADAEDGAEGGEEKDAGEEGPEQGEFPAQESFSLGYRRRKAQANGGRIPLAEGLVAARLAENGPGALPRGAEEKAVVLAAADMVCLESLHVLGLANISRAAASGLGRTRLSEAVKTHFLA